ncbi:MAG: S8 family peptidase [Lachnospiraceae bacterium]|nr:S8 family peptidase [Lachnospiraceae bacterium]MBQ8765538.1 S8 family peptidase [Clostridia bacterium]
MERAKRIIRHEEAIRQKALGHNVTIAFLDSGICEHPDLQGKVIGFRDFVNKRVKPYDDSGHGTHVCGIALGTGHKSNGVYSGVAPDSNAIVGKVLDSEGNGNTEQMLEGIEWLIELNKSIPIHVLNISIGVKAEFNSANERRLMEAVEKAWDAGMVVVCASGNSGPGPMTLSPMAMSKKVITVGCHDMGYCSKSGYKCEDYSGRGPSPYDIRKPDIVAPGTDIVSCNYRFMGKRMKQKSYYISKSGTSMSTPMVSGAIASLISSGFLGDNERIKRQIRLSATDLKENWLKQGWGMLNIENLLTKAY